MPVRHVLLPALALLLPGLAHAEQVTVFAAASLKNAMDDIVARYQAQSGHSVVVSLAGSSALAKQIQQGAPADIFISANPDWMDLLEAEGLLEDGSRRDLLGNSLVLVAHGTDAAPVTIGPDLDLPALLGEGRLAMALVDSVPAGIYGKAALDHLGLWQGVAPSVAQSDNVRAALALVATGEAPLGIVYATDAMAEPKVHVVGRFPADSHPPIVYPAAAMADPGEAALAFLQFLGGEEAAAIFISKGFEVLEE